MRTPSPKQGSEHGEVVRPGHCVHGDSSECDEHSYPASKWDIDFFLKNGDSLFTASTNPEATLVWFV